MKQVYDIFMNFFVTPCDIREINKQGRGGSKLAARGLQKSQKSKHCPPPLPIYFEPKGSVQINILGLYVHAKIMLFTISLFLNGKFI